MGDFYVSPTGLARFFSCPAAYQYSRQWTAVEEKWWLKLGSDVHALMAGEIPSDMMPQAIPIQKRLYAFEQELGYQITEREKKEVVTLTKGIQLVRVIDAVASPTIVDYKVPNGPWDVVPGTEIAPKAQTFQSTAYLWGREDHDLHYLVAPSDGSPVERHVYVPGDDDMDNMMQAVDIMRWSAENDKWPYNRGFGCKWCDYIHVCYDAPDWRSKYVPRE